MNSQSLRLAFMGSPDFSVPVLDALIGAGHRIEAVYCQPPRGAGRGQKLRPCPVQVFAQSKNLEIHHPADLKDTDVQAGFAGLELDAAVVAAYGLILPPAILAVPRMGCINVHASLLPRWRGAAPIQRAIEAGDEESGVTIMAMDEGLDTGAMLISEATPIIPGMNAGMLHDALAEIGARLITRAVAGLAAGEIEPVPQPDRGVTMAKKIDPAEGQIDWTRTGSELERAVRAFSPWPGAWFDHDGGRIKVFAASLEEGAGMPGTVLDDQLTIACGEAALRPTRLQRAGKSPMETTDFLRGYELVAGTRLCPR